MSLLDKLRNLILEDLINNRDHYEDVDDIIKEAFCIGQLSKDDAIARLDNILTMYRN